MMRKLFVTAILFTMMFTASIVAHPQDGNRNERDEARLRQLIEKIGLTKEQSPKVKKILQRAREEARKVFENNNGDPAAFREVMVKQRENTETEIMKLLSKEQKLKYETFQKERLKERQERMRERQ